MCDHVFWHGPALEALDRAGGRRHRHQERRHRDLCLAAAAAPRADGRQGGGGARPSVGRTARARGGRRHPRRRVRRGGCRVQRRGAVASTRGSTRCAAPGRSPRATATRNSPRRAHIPVWVGGSSEAALRRAARRATGGSRCSSLPTSTPRPWVDWTKRPNGPGAIPRTVTRATVAFVSVGDPMPPGAGLSWMASLYGLPARSFERHLVAGTARTCAKALARFAESGARARRGLRDLGRPAGTVRGPGRRVRRPSRIPPRPPGGACSRPGRPRSRGPDERRAPVGRRLCRSSAVHRSKTRFGGEVVVRQDVSIVGIGMTPMDRRDLTPDVMAGQAVRAALDDAGLSPGDVGLVIAANAAGRPTVRSGLHPGPELAPRRRTSAPPASSTWTTPVREGPRPCTSACWRHKPASHRSSSSASRRCGRATGQRPSPGSRTGCRPTSDAELRVAPRERRRQRAHGAQRHVGPAPDRGARHDATADRRGRGQGAPSRIAQPARPVPLAGDGRRRSSPRPSWSHH